MTPSPTPVPSDAVEAMAQALEELTIDDGLYEVSQERGRAALRAYRAHQPHPPCDAETSLPGGDAAPGPSNAVTAAELGVANYVSATPGMPLQELIGRRIFGCVWSEFPAAGEIAYEHEEATWLRWADIVLADLRASGWTVERTTVLATARTEAAAAAREAVFEEAAQIAISQQVALLKLAEEQAGNLGLSGIVLSEKAGTASEIAALIRAAQHRAAQPEGSGRG